MKFSIIIPVYQVEKYIEPCLQSVMAQSYEDYEVILVDDGSQDASGKICDRYAQKDARIQVIHQENQGLAGARNAGLFKAKGEWICFLDSDDWVEPDWLMTISKAMKKHPAHMYSFNTWKEYEDRREKLLYVVENETIYLRNEEEKQAYFYGHFMQYHYGWEAWGRIYRRDLIQKHGILFQPTQEVFAEDYLFTFTYLLYADRIHMLCNLLHHYRQRENSLLQTTGRKGILRKLGTLALRACEETKKAGFRYGYKRFHELFFMILNFHLQHMLVDMDPKEREQELKEIQKNRQVRQWIKRLQKERALYETDMRIVKWL